MQSTEITSIIDKYTESDWTMIGARLLGISMQEADRLFSGANRDQQARDILARMIDEAVAEEKRKAEAGELGAEGETD